MIGLHLNLAVPVPPWEQSPRKLISLWDMIRVLGIEIHNIQAALEHYEQYFGTVQSVDETTAKELREFLNHKLFNFCRSCGFETTIQCLHFLRNKTCAPLSGEVAKSSVSDLLEAFRIELSATQFLYTPKSKVGYHARDDLFDKADQEFHTLASAEINAEIKNAGNCLAADLNTAAVFHLMRVVEHGVRALANHVKTSPGKWPTDYDGWGDLITKIDGQLSDMEQAATQMTRGPQKDNELAVFRSLRREIEYFKDKDRNPCCHTRKTYSANDAIVVYDHVREFMQRLAAKVSLV